MKVTVLRENLAQGLNIVTRAVAARSSLPVLANVLLATDDGRLRLSATNLEMGITCWIGAKIEEEGSTTVPARTFSELVSTLTDSKVDLALTVRTQTLGVRSGTTNANLKCIDAQEFPPMPVSDTTGGIQLNVTDLKEMIQQVVFAAAADETRPVLTGVQVKVSGNKISMGAADGFRFSLRSAELSEPIARPLSAIIPARALAELGRILNEASVVMSLPLGRSQVIFRGKDVELVSQLIEGTFPDLEALIPRNTKTRTVVSTPAILKACKQAEIFARDNASIARFNVKPGGEMMPGAVEISGQSEESGSNLTTIEASIDGPGLLIAFNVRFIREVLEVIKTPNVVLETTTDETPGMVRPVGDENYIHVIMPMKL